jgi:RHH-type rel operon transcriptional repressor/antitoxin RelB
MAALSIHLPEDISARLKAICERTGRTQDETILEALQEHLEDVEDIFVADQRLADLRAGRSRTYSLDEVERELGLAD